MKDWENLMKDWQIWPGRRREPSLNTTSKNTWTNNLSDKNWDFTNESRCLHRDTALPGLLTVVYRKGDIDVV